MLVAGGLAGTNEAPVASASHTPHGDSLAEEPAVVADTPQSIPDAPPTINTDPALENHITQSLGYGTLQEACNDQIIWACNISAITAPSETEVEVHVTKPHPEVNPRGIASGVYNFLTNPAAESIESPLPHLERVTVIDSNGEVLARK